MFKFFKRNRHDTIYVTDDQIYLEMRKPWAWAMEEALGAKVKIKPDCVVVTFGKVVINYVSKEK